MLIREDLTRESRLGARIGKADTLSWGRDRAAGVKRVSKSRKAGLIWWLDMLGWVCPRISASGDGKGDGGPMGGHVEGPR